MRRVSMIAFAGAFATMVCAFAPNAHGFTLSTMMCVGNGCPNRVYAYHKCSGGFVWSARTHRCVRRVDEDARRAPGKSPKTRPPQ